MTPTSETFLGNFIGGRFVQPAHGRPFTSHDPSTDGDVVLEAVADVDAVEAAVAAARGALPAWRRLPLEGRIAALQSVKAAFQRHAERIAQAITREMGKSIVEARGEAALLAQKVDGIVSQLPYELPAAPPGAPGEQRFHPLGAVGIIGPFNFPAHLVNTHLIPTLITGNTVVAKPSEVTPLVGQLYAECFAESTVPAGVFNLVHGLGETGSAIATHPALSGLVFTGSFRTGRLIRQATFDQPHKQVNLELGGKNPALVLDDADLDNTVREILLGALLTTGQRCTATSRVICTPGIADALRSRLVESLSRIQPGDPKDERTLMGPLATAASRDRFVALLSEAGARPSVRILVESRRLADRPGCFVTPGLYEVAGDEAIVTEELFGPHVAFEVARDEDDVFARAARNPYGLSAALFSARESAFERLYDEVPVGVLNFNRSTNGASGLLPFGGVGMSGNYRAAGSAAPRLCTYPAALMKVAPGTHTPNAQLDAQLGVRP